MKEVRRRIEEEKVVDRAESAAEDDGRKAEELTEVLALSRTGVN